MTDALSTHYAAALADAVFDPNSGINPDQALRELAAATELVTSSPELHRVLMSPAVAKEKKTQIVGSLLEQLAVGRLVRNFVMVLVSHRRIGEIERIRESFEIVVDQRQGFERAEIRSARELTESQREELIRALSTAAGKKIRPVYKVDDSLLGGVIARVGSREYDGSLIGRLETMRRRLSPAS